MRKIKIFTYNSASALSNKYLEVIIQYLELKLFNEKVEFLFYKNKKTNKLPLFQLSH